MILALLALSLSIDALVVGISLGIEKIRVSSGARCVVCCLSMAAALASMLLGSGLAALCSPHAAAVVGATILFAMGLWILVSGLVRGDPRCQGAMDEITLFEVAFRSLGVTLRILKSPETSDVDRSGNIDAAESLPLGLALSLDILGAGVGLGAMGMASTGCLPPWACARWRC